LVAPQAVTQTGTAGGAYSSTAGLTIDAVTGAITPGTSTAGTYTVTYTIAAAGGCGVVIATTTVIISPNAAIALTSAAGTDAQTLNISTILTNITYSVTGGGTGATITGLPAGVSGSYLAGVFTISGTPTAAGTFNYTVNTTGTCLQASMNGTITVNSSAPLSGSVTTQTNVNCFGNSTGSLTVAGSGGTAPYQYKLGAGLYQASGTFSLLAAGPYTVTIMDALSATFSVAVTITQPAAALAATFIVTNVNCFGGNTGAVSLTVTGGIAPFTYSWTGPSGYVSAAKDIIGLVAGIYTVTVTDAGGCTTGVSATITQPASALNATATVSNVLCSGGNNGSVTLTVSGGTAPYTYLWSNSATTKDISSLVAGSYTVKVTDSNGCFVNISATVTQPTVLTIESTVVDATCPQVRDGSITLTITGGTAPYTFIWSDGVTTAIRTAIDSTYSVVVTDANLCAASANNIVVSFKNGSGCLEIPKVITPNGDGKNDTWIMKNIDMYPNAEVQIFNRWGKLIYKTKNIAANPWDGRYQGNFVPVDSYTYILYLGDGSKPKSGEVSVIR
jgi:gliding motility-associated-like protein